MQQAGFLFSYSSNLKMGTISSTETSVDFQRTTCRYVPEDLPGLFIYLNYDHGYFSSTKSKGKSLTVSGLGGYTL
jgi:hypothetical protein